MVLSEALNWMKRKTEAGVASGEAAYDDGVAIYKAPQPLGESLMRNFVHHQAAIVPAARSSRKNGGFRHHSLATQWADYDLQTSDSGNTHIRFQAHFRSGSRRAARAGKSEAPGAAGVANREEITVRPSLLPRLALAWLWDSDFPILRFLAKKQSCAISTRPR